MKLNFSKTPVSREAIDRAVAKREAELEEVRALAYATDEAACQKVVDMGRKHLAMLRKAASEFAKRFKALEAAKNPVEFVQLITANRLHFELGSVTLEADYDDDDE